MKVIKPPTFLNLDDYEQGSDILFAAGSIEQGKATLWQDRLAEHLKDVGGYMLNPRRDNWDPSWTQDPTPGTPFYEQVNWELDGLKWYATHVCFYFDPETISPITMMELGLNIFEGHSEAFNINERLFVYCPKTFWRYGNIKIVCDRHGVVVHEEETNFFVAIRQSLLKEKANVQNT